MINTVRCRSSPISQNPGVVNTFPEIYLKGYNAQNKEFVKRFFEKKYCLPQAQNESVVNSIFCVFEKFFGYESSTAFIFSISLLLASFLFIGILFTSNLLD